MVGGKIIDFYKTKSIHGKDEVFRFLVKDARTSDTCCVESAIPKSVISEVSIGDSIWWHCGKVFLNVFGCPDTPFHKHGNSGGDAKVFYQLKLSEA